MFAHDKESKATLNECMKAWLEFREEVLYCVVEGETKEFTLILVPNKE